MKKKIIILFLLLFCSSALLAFDDKITHPELTGRTVKTNEKYFEEFLIKELLFEEGFDQPVGGKAIIEILQEGSQSEDDDTRALNHFHRPIPCDGSMGQQPWIWAEITEPYIAPLLGHLGKLYSAAVWGTDYIGAEEPHGTGNVTQNEMNWDHARELYKDGLIELAETSDVAIFSQALQAVGQVMHLIQDMAVPAHTLGGIERG